MGKKKRPKLSNWLACYRSDGGHGWEHEYSEAFVCAYDMPSKVTTKMLKDAMEMALKEVGYRGKRR